ncbi:MAG: FGGY-family carbohydrate kinase [Candidatus Thiodiazotropha sp.]
MSLFIGIDLGTSGCRGIAIDVQGAVRGMATWPLPQPVSRTPGQHEQDPGLWWEAVCRVVGALRQQTHPGDIAALAVDGTSSTLLLADATGTPLTPGLMYNDTRARDSLDALQRVAPAESPVLSASSSLAKLLHLYPASPGTGTFALHQADWIVGRFTGEYPLSDENNALKLGYDPLNRCWPEWIGSLGIPLSCLPRVVPCGTPLANLSPRAADETGLPPGIPVIAGTTDSNAAFLASGARQIGDAVTSLGSTLVLKVLTDRPVSDARYGIYSHRLGDLWLAGGASNSGGAVLRQHFSDQQIQRMTRKLRPQYATGLDYYPLPAQGERFPLNDPDKLPQLSPRPDDPVIFFQALLEGIAQIEHQGYQLLHQLGTPYPKRVFSMGGGARNPGWVEIRRQRLRVPVQVAEHQQAAYGTALLARQGAGIRNGSPGSAFSLNHPEAD